MGSGHPRAAHGERRLSAPGAGSFPVAAQYLFASGKRIPNDDSFISHGGAGRGFGVVWEHRKRSLRPIN